MELKASLKYARIGVLRTRRVANLIRGQSIGQAGRILSQVENKSSYLFQKLLNSAVAQAQASEVDVDRLYLKTVYVNAGPHLKRSRPAARSQIAYRNKKQSHLHLVLGEK